MAKECSECNEDLSRYSTHFAGHGLCPDCLKESKGLMKVIDEDGEYYVPWDYRYYIDTFEARHEDMYEDVNARLPKVEWCDKHKKYKLTFDAPDLGGYDSTILKWYFDSKEDVIKAIFKEV